MMQIALLRHGHTAWNRAGRIQGRSDIPLDEEAIDTLRGLQLPPPWDEADIWASPLQRATQTAELVAGRTPMAAEALTEMDWGEWEGLIGKDLRADPATGFRDIEAWGWEYRPHGGESASEVAARVHDWLETLARPAVLVCHIGVMRMILARGWGWNFDGPCPFSIKRNRLYLLTRDGRGWTPEPEPVRLLKTAP